MEMVPKIALVSKTSDQPNACCDTIYIYMPFILLNNFRIRLSYSIYWQYVDGNRCCEIYWRALWRTTNPIMPHSARCETKNVNKDIKIRKLSHWCIRTNGDGTRSSKHQSQSHLICTSETRSTLPRPFVALTPPTNSHKRCKQKKNRARLIPRQPMCHDGHKRCTVVWLSYG